MLYFSYKIRKGINQMTKKIYIDWENQEYHTSIEGVRESFERYASYTEFDDFLDCHYSSETIFNFSKDERTEVLEDYQAVLDEEMEDWIDSHMTVIDIELEFKEK